MMFAQMSSALPHIKTGKLRAIGVASLEALAAAPELPTIAEQGLPEFEAVSWYALMAPSGTPQAIIDKVAAETARIVNQPDNRKKFEGLGMAPVGNRPQELAATIEAETQRWVGGDPQAEHQAGVNERGLRLALLPDFGASTFGAGMFGARRPSASLHPKPNPPPAALHASRVAPTAVSPLK